MKIFKNYQIEDSLYYLAIDFVDRCKNDGELRAKEEAVLGNITDNETCVIFGVETKTKFPYISFCELEKEDAAKVTEEAVKYFMERSF